MKRIKTVVVFVAISFVMVVIRVYVGSIVEYHKGDEFLIKKEYDKAADHYERAIRWYVPFNPFAKNAAKNMLFVCHKFYSDKNYEVAYNCLDRLRGSIYSIRSFYQPYSDILKNSEVLMTHVAEGMKVDMEKFKDSLKKDMAPDLFGTILVLVGFLLWTSAIVLLILFSDKKLKVKLFMFAMFLIGFFMWIFGLKIA